MIRALKLNGVIFTAFKKGEGYEIKGNITGRNMRKDDRIV